MERTIVLIRHAKTNPAAYGQDDFDRRLTDRGEQDAPMMGTRLKQMGLLPELIVSSTAKRAGQTARRIARATGYDAGSIQWADKLYLCAASEFSLQIAALPDAVRTVFIVAHNPGITSFANRLTPMFRIDHLPTSGVVAAKAETGTWEEFGASEKKVFLFDHPRKIS